ncbi:hypothetical protein GCM10028778_21500 [Barrientosiimonas marina]|uniref:SCO7613 C-terminal domain-containing membrane protein n=1 Tax=Lentibacillus kimchii TaxID=1542911 RepID=A0ABW2UW97_9BACI
MSTREPSDREKVTKEEIRQLKEKQYITPGVYEEIIQRYEQFLKDDQTYVQDTFDQENEAIQQNLADKTNPENKAASTKTYAAFASETPAAQQSDSDQSAVHKTVPKQKSKQQIRDQNITWSLSIGIILLLIGGTVLATSNWDIMSSWMKTGMIAAIAALFFGLAVFTKNILKIRKTALAFYVLGNLFLPIVYISLGFYEQLGTYFSPGGEGRYLYGATGSLLLFSVYLYSAFKLNTRLFVWFANSMLTLFAGFFIGWLDLSVDGFYLGVILFNSLLVGAYQYLKRQAKWQLFVNEFTLYIQANLILSTLLMLLFYSNDVFHGFNLLLTAAVYMSMLYVTKRTEYFFVFTLMLVYGAYQTIEFSVAHNIGAVAYALLGFVFLVLPKLIAHQAALDKLFKYTSAVVSGFAFIYISVQGLLIHMDDPSLTLILAYFLIAGNYIYLSNLTDIKRTIFYYLSSAFLLAGLFELVRLGQTILPYESMTFSMFIVSFAFYVGVGCLGKLPYLKAINTSARDMAMLVMAVCLLWEAAAMNWMHLGIMLLLTSALGVVMDAFEQRLASSNARLTAYLLQPIALGLAVTMFYMTGQGDILPGGDPGPFAPVPLVLASLSLLLATFIWQQLKRHSFSNQSFYVAQGFYLLAIFQTLSLTNLEFNPTLRYVIILGGVIMAYLLYRKVASAIIPYVMGLFTLLFYLSLLYALHDGYALTSELFISLQFAIGAFLLFVTGAGFWRFDQSIANAYWYVAHIYYPLALIVSLFYGDIAVWSAMLAVVVYGVSTWAARVEWTRKLCLYAGLTSFWLLVMYTMLSFDRGDDLHYASLITTILLTSGWALSNTIWRQRIIYYVIPFSLIGLMNFALLHPFDLTQLIVTMLYTSIILGMLHIQKWDTLNGIPLMILFIALINFIQTHPTYDDIVLVVASVIFLIIGLLLYPVIYKAHKATFPLVDWYTIAGFVSLGFLYVYDGDTLFQQLLPGILVSLAIYVQRNRLPFVAGKWLVAGAVGYLLQPYYTLLNHLAIPDLIEAECYVLPWVGLAMFIKAIAGKQHQRLMNDTQWVVLVLVSLVLVQDGLQSNTVYDAIILGSLSLLAMLGGMMFKQKSFFFTGSGVLLLNLLIQTRPFWGNMPWWVYLLIAGSILITVASYYEWHKQKTSKGNDTFMTLFYKNVVQRIKKWE